MFYVLKNIFMSEFSLTASKRDLSGRKTDALRALGKVPAVVYGVGTEPQNIEINRNQFVKVYNQAGESSVIELAIDAQKTLPVLIQDYQLDPVRSEVIHVDFRAIDMSKEIEAEVDLEFVGEALAVKALGGTFVPLRNHVSIKCLPTKLMRNITIDISVLKTFDDAIHVSDLPVMEGVQIIDDAETTLAMVEAPRSEEEMAALDKAVEMDVTAVEVESKEKTDEAGEAKAE